jgi:hypothetical protein
MCSSRGKKQNEARTLFQHLAANINNPITALTPFELFLTKLNQEYQPSVAAQLCMAALDCQEKILGENTSIPKDIEELIRIGVLLTPYPDLDPDKSPYSTSTVDLLNKVKEILANAHRNDT